MVKSGVLQISSVAIWVFTKSNSDEFMKFYIWEILHSTVKRTIKNIQHCTKQLNEAKEKLSKVISPNLTVFLEKIDFLFILEK